MAILSPNQIAGYAKAAGFTGRNIPIAVAICLAESGGDTNAINHNSNGTADHGLWQINDVHSDLLAKGDPNNPAANAAMAYSVYKSSGWRAWSTFNSGAYLKHLGKGQAAAGNPTAVNAGGNPTAVNAGWQDLLAGPGVLALGPIGPLAGLFGFAAGGSPTKDLNPANAIPDATGSLTGFLTTFQLVAAEITKFLGQVTNVSFWRRVVVVWAAVGAIGFAFMLMIDSDKTVQDTIKSSAKLAAVA